MKCEEARQLISPYIDLVLTEKETTRLEKHLANCAACRAELAELRSLVDSFKRLEDLQAPAGFMDELRMKLRDDKVVQFPHRHTMITQINPRGWVAASVASVALAMGIYISSLVPYQVVANIFDKIPQAIFQKDEGLPADIEKLIKEKQTELHIAQNTQQGTSPADKNATGTNGGEKSNPLVQQPSNPNTVVPVQPSTNGNAGTTAETKAIDTVNIQMKVADVSGTVDDLKQLAASKDAVAETSYSTLATGNNRVVTIRVAEDKADELIGIIKEMGYTVEPSKTKVDITQDYARMQNRLQEVQGEIKALSGKDSLTTAEKDKLKVLDFEKSYLADKLTNLNENTQLVAINIILSEKE
ncbi:MAG: zf-HC2 domain-containing protein [Ignavibacteriales bacterium]